MVPARDATMSHHCAGDGDRRGPGAKDAAPVVVSEVKKPEGGKAALDTVQGSVYHEFPYPAGNLGGMYQQGRTCFALVPSVFAAPQQRRQGEARRPA